MTDAIILIDMQFITSTFLNKNLVICGNRPYQTTTAYSYYTNWLTEIKIKIFFNLLCFKNFTCENKSFGAAKVIVLSCKIKF